MTLSIPSSSDSFFRNSTRYLLGLNIDGAVASTTDIATANKLWTDFLRRIGKTEAQFEASTPEQYKTLYNDYLLDKLSYIYYSESINLLTADEIAARDIIFKTIDLILKMLAALQKGLITSSQALTFYTKWQEMYTREMTKSPLYSTTPSNTPAGNLTSIARSKVTGYAGITVADVLGYLMNQAITTQTAQSYTWGNENKTLFTLTLDATKKIYTFSQRSTYTFGNSPSSTSTMTFDIFSVSYTNPSGAAFAAGDIPAAIEGLTAAATNSINAHADNENIDSEMPGLTWGWFRQGYVSPGTLPNGKYFSYAPVVNWSSITNAMQNITTPTQDDKNNQQKRGELNSQLQMYISNTQARRDSIQTAQKPMENMVTQFRESMQAQCSLLDNMIDTIRGLIGAIYRV